MKHQLTINALTVFLLGILCFFQVAVGFAAPGDLDTTFAGTGKTRTGFGFGTDSGNAMSAQLDGKVVVAGSSSNGSDRDFSVVRYNTDGSLDTSFGIGGKVLTRIKGEDEAVAVRIQTDGRIVVAGNSNKDGNNDFAVVRYNTDGSPDSSFDGDGMVITDLGDNLERANAAAIQSDGKIIVAGRDKRDLFNGFGSGIAVLRYNTDGSLDTSFGVDGAVFTTIGLLECAANAVLIQQGGKIVVAGVATDDPPDTSSEDDFAVVRYNTDGSLDTTFSGDGKVTTDFGANDSGNAVGFQFSTTQPLKIVVAGRSRNNGSNTDFAVARYNADGSLDTTFDGDGKLTTAIGTDLDVANAVAIQLSGQQPSRIIVAGYSYNDNGSSSVFAVVRYLLDGSLDTAFDGDGKVTTAVGIASVGNAMMISAGKLVVAGATRANGGANDDFAVVRYNLSDGSLDNSFDGDGKRVEDVGNGAAQAKSVVIQPDGKIVVAGINSIGSTDGFAVARYNTDRSFDTSFDNDGRVITDVSGGNDLGNAITIQPDGRIVVAGYSFLNVSDTEISVVRYNTDGSLDTSFDGDGKVLTPVDSTSQATAVAIQSDGKIVVAGTSDDGSNAYFAVVRYNTNGSLDASFDGDGKVTTDIGGGSNFGNAMTIQSDGKIVVAGNSLVGSTDDFAVVRYNPNGSLDTSFSDDGKLTSPVGSGRDVAHAVAIQTGGKTIVAGSSRIGSTDDFAVVRYNSDGSLDTSFDGDGKVTTAIGTGTDSGNAIAIQTDDKIIVAGSSIGSTNDQFVVVRYNTDGFLDPSYGSGGKVVVDASNGFAGIGFGVALDSVSRAVVVGSGGGLFGVVRFLGDFQPTAPIWQGATSSDWLSASNWSGNFAPISSDDVLLPVSGVSNEAALNTDVSIHSLIVEAGRTLTINPGKTLTVNGDLQLKGTIVGGGTIIFNGANFINNGSVNGVNVQFDTALHQLSGAGSFLGNTVTVLFGSTLQLNSNHTMSRIVVDSGGTLNIPSGKTLSLFGSGVVLTTNGSVTGTGAISFNGTSAQSTSGNVAFGSLTINNAAGVTLGGNSVVNGTLSLMSGDLNAGAFTLTMPAAAASTGTTDVVGNIKRTGVTTMNTLSFGNPLNTIQFTSGTPPTNITVNLVKQTPPDFTNATRRTYTITPNGGSGFAATLRLHYQDSELNGNTETTLALWRKTSWTNLGATMANATDNWVELAGVTQFSPWVISGPAAPTVANSISGTISYCIDQTKKIPNASVGTTSGSPSDATTTNASGFYQLHNLGSGPYTVASSKTGAVSGITAFDAALVAQYVAGIATPTSCQQLAGDASNNGTLSAFDAAFIAQTVAGIPNPGIVGTWKFIPATRSYPTLSGNVINENYDAVFVGDVSGNWTPAGPEGPPKGAIGAPTGGANVAVSLPSQAAAPGSTNVMVPVFAGNTTGQGIIAYDFTFTFDASVIQPASPAFETSGTLSTGWTITPNTSTPGQLRIVAFNTVPLSGQGTLIFLKFNVVGSEGAVTPMTWTNFAFNEGTPTATLTNGNFTASGPTMAKLEKFTATGYDGGVYLEWKTGLEADNLGFNLYRERAGQRELVTPEVVAGSALLTGQTRLQTGRTYSWWDKGIADCGSPSADCKNAQYWVEDIDLNGQSNWHGPVSPQLVGGTPPTQSDAAVLSRIGNSQAPHASTPVERRTLARVSSGQAAIQPVPASASAVKVSVRHEGWYSLSSTELVAAGLNPNADPDRLQMYVDGEQIPINVITGDKSQLSAIEFYGAGLDAAYTDARAYLIAEGKEKGLRIEQVNADAHPSSARSFSYSVERRDRTIYFSGLRNGERENFFGSVVGRETIVQSLTLQHLDRSTTEQAQVEVSMQGVTTIPHRVWVNVNSSFVGEVVFNGQERKAASFSLPPSLLREGDNAVQLVARGGPADVSLIDYVRLSYPRTFTAESDQLRFVATEGAAVTVDGFSSAAIRVFDVTNQDRVQQLVGKIEQGKNGYYAITVAPAEKGERTLLATAGQTAGSQSRLSASVASDLRGNNHAANLLIITNRDFAALESLKKLRTSQGYKVEIVDVEAIYDQFSFGNKSPYAVRDFLLYARTNWKIAPQYVLLAGDASYDPKNYLGFGHWDIVPTKLIDTTLMETACDDWFADFNQDGVPEMAVGRLPARTREEAESLVARIIGYEQSSSAAELTLVADANDGYDFEAANSKLRALMPGDVRVVEIARGRMGTEAKAALIEAINRGQKIVNYTGHGNVNQWRADLLTNADAALLTNQNHLSVFVMMTCLNGYFGDPALSSLAEALMKTGPAGAVAVWASSGMTMPDEQALMNQEFYRQLFANRGIALGDAINRAKAAVGDGDVRRTWVLIGDPTMKVR